MPVQGTGQIFSKTLEGSLCSHVAHGHGLGDEPLTALEAVLILLGCWGIATESVLVHMSTCISEYVYICIYLMCVRVFMHVDTLADVMQ